MDSSFVFKSFGMLFDLFGGRNLEYVEKCPWLTHSLSPALTPTLRCKCQIPNPHMRAAAPSSIDVR